LFIAQPINNLMFLYKAIHAVLEKPDILELLDWPTLNAVKRVQEAIRGSVSHSKKGQSEQGQAIDSIHRFLDEGYPEIEKRLPPIKLGRGGSESSSTRLVHRLREERSSRVS